MSLPITPTTISPANPDRMAAPPRASDPTAANPGAQKPPVVGATGGEVAIDRTVPAAFLKQATEAENLKKNLPAGPPPSFEETLLERRARVALEFPPVLETTADNAERDDVDPDIDPRETSVSPETRQAQERFAETRALAEPDPPNSLDTRG